MIKFIKFIECTNCPENIWIVCQEEDKYSSFLVVKKDLIDYLKKADTNPKEIKARRLEH